MSKLVVELPGANEKGFLRRTQRALAFRDKLTSLDISSVGSAFIDEMIEFLVDFVKEPADREEAKEMLLDASQAQFLEMVNSIAGGEANPTLPKQTERSMSNGQKDLDTPPSGQ